MEFGSALQVMIRPASIATINQYDNESLKCHSKQSLRQRASKLLRDALRVSDAAND